MIHEQSATLPNSVIVPANRLAASRPQTEVNDHSANLAMTCGQQIESPS